ncbi:MAG: hypothetical protein ACLQDQ_17065 [Myxococcaceae bacterium]
MESLLKVIFPGAVMLILVGGIVFRLTVKPTIDAILRLREGLRSDQDQTQRRLARLEQEVSRLRDGQAAVPPALDAGSWSVRRD